MSRAKYISFFILHILCKFVRIGPQIKKFPKNWVGPLNAAGVIWSYSYKLSKIYSMNLLNVIEEFYVRKK